MGVGTHPPTHHPPTHPPHAATLAKGETGQKRIGQKSKIWPKEDWPTEGMTILARPGRRGSTRKTLGERQKNAELLVTARRGEVRGRGSLAEGWSRRGAVQREERSEREVREEEGPGRGGQQKTRGAAQRRGGEMWSGPAGAHNFACPKCTLGLLDHLM